MPVAKAVLQNSVLCMFWAPCWLGEVTNNDRHVANLLASYTPTYPLASNESLQVTVDVNLEDLHMQRAENFINLLILITMVRET